MISTDDFAKKLTEGLSLDQNYKLSQAVIPINIISYDIDNDKPRICSTYEAKKDPKKDFNLKDAFLASIALPPYFLKKLPIQSMEKNYMIMMEVSFILLLLLFLSHILQKKII